MTDQESSQQRSAWSARSYDGLREPGETERCSQDLARWSSTLLDDLIRPRQHRRWDGEPERFGRLQVDHELELRNLLHGKVCRFAPLRILST